MDERTPSFLFDVFRWQEHPELEAIFNRLWNEMPKSRIRSTAEEQKRCLRLFLCNLYVSHYYEKPIAVPLKYSTFTEGRYKKLFIKRVPFLMVFRFLEAKGLMTVKKGIVTYSSSFDTDSTFTWLASAVQLFDTPIRTALSQCQSFPFFACH